MDSNSRLRSGSQRILHPIAHIPRYSMLFLDALMTPLMIFFAAAGNFITLASAVLFYHYEKELNPQVETFFDAIWWALCTVTTVGFGDVIPVSIQGKVVGIGLMLGGILCFVSSTAVLVSVMTARASQEAEKQDLTIEHFKLLDEQLQRLHQEVKELKQSKS